MKWWFRLMGERPVYRTNLLHYAPTYSDFDADFPMKITRAFPMKQTIVERGSYVSVVWEVWGKKYEVPRKTKRVEKN